MMQRKKARQSPAQLEISRKEDHFEPWLKFRRENPSIPRENKGSVKIAHPPQEEHAQNLDEN